MMNRAQAAARNRIAVSAILMIASGVAVIAAPPPDMSWRTIDSGGGGLTGASGQIELTATIGQPGVGVTMTAPGIELTGGFWAGASSTPSACACPGDVTPDSLINGEDIQAFVDCLTSGGANCACADMDINSTLDMTDVTLFVDGLLAGGPCP